MKIGLSFIFITYALTGTAQQKNGLINSGNALYIKQRFSEAATIYRQAAKNDPNNFNIIYNLALAEFKDGQLQRSISDFSQIISHTPDKLLAAQSTYNIGVVYVKCNDLSRAINAFENALKFNPEDSLSRDNLQLALNAQRDHQQISNISKNAAGSNKTKSSRESEKGRLKITDKKKADEILNKLLQKEKKTRDSIQKSRRSILKTRTENDW